MNGESKRNFLLNTAYIAVWAALAVFAVKYLLGWLLPLVLGFCIAFALRPLINAVYKISTATRRFCAIAVLICVYAALGVLLWLAVIQLAAGLRWLFVSLPSLYSSTIAPALEQLNAWVLELLGRFLPDISPQFEAFSAAFSEQASIMAAAATDKLINSASAFVRGIPAFMLTFLFTVLSSFFISMDYVGVVSFFARLVPKRHRKTLFEIKDFLVLTVFRYIRAYSLLLAITFCEVWFGLALLRVPNSGLWALVTAAADILPAIGTGLILLPWALVALLQGDKILCIGILTLYGVITLVRNIIEPKIVGDKIGLSPLATITAMFFGLNILGVAGLFLAPILVLVIKFLNDSGHLKLW